MIGLKEILASVAAAVHGPANPLFDRKWYLATNPDVAAAGLDPWLHYLKHGAAEQRDPNPLFQSDWYVSQYLDLGARVGEPAQHVNPLLHYWNDGAAQGCNPNRLFDGAWYLQNNPDARAAGLNPSQHYLQSGAAQGRDPCAEFDTAWYLRTNPDLSPGALTPLGDYLRYGHLEGRSYRRPAHAGHSSRAPGGKARAQGRERVVVYTAIVGDYDCLKMPIQVDPDCDYYCFTDRDISWQDIWIRRDFSWRNGDPVRVARHVKHNPQVYFADYDYSIWLDANLQLNCSPLKLMPERRDSWDMAVWRHPYRDCVYAEAERCVLDGKDDASTIRAQMQRYRSQGFPEHAGLNENNVLVRRHNVPAMVDLACAWWNEIDRASRRDQLSFGYVARSRNVRVTHIGVPGSNSRNDPRLRFFAHTQRRPLNRA